jgi:hypothetical protein
LPSACILARHFLGRFRLVACQSRPPKGGQSLLLVVAEHEITSVRQVVDPSPDSSKRLESRFFAHGDWGGSPKAPKSRCGVVLCTSVGLSQALAIVRKKHLRDFSRFPPLLTPRLRGLEREQLGSTRHGLKTRAHSRTTSSTAVTPDVLEGNLIVLECPCIRGRRCTIYIFIPIGLICVPACITLLSKRR